MCMYVCMLQYEDNDEDTSSVLILLYINPCSLCFILVLYVSVFHCIAFILGTCRERYAPVKELLSSPQQTNGYDCGVYVCLCTQLFAASPLLPLLLPTGTESERTQRESKKQTERDKRGEDFCMHGIVDPSDTHPHSTQDQDVEDIIAAGISSAVTPARAAAFRIECIELIASLSKEYLIQKNV